jgi:hypothetical protein
MRIAGISGEPVALSLPETAQLLEPLASVASPIERRTASICSTRARPSPDHGSWFAIGLPTG